MTMYLSSAKLHKSYFWIMLFGVCLFISGCEKPIENPELSDSIYNDLLQDSKTSTSLADTEKKTLDGIEKEISELKPGDNSRKSKFRQKFESQTKIDSFLQKAQYFNLRAFKRKEYVLDTYPKYFAKHLHWPDAEEWADYQASKRLQLASRDWATRVPKLGKRIKTYNAAASAEFSGGPKPEGAKKEGGEEKPKTEEKSE